MVVLTSDQFLADAAADPAEALGPALVGIQIDVLLLGAVIGCFVYWKSFIEESDTKMVRCLMYWMIIGTVAHSILVQAFSWHIFVANYGNFSSLLGGWWTQGVVLVESLVVTPIEIFYARRAYVLWNKSILIGSIIGLCITASMALGLAMIANTPSGGNGVGSSPLFVSWAICLALMDIGISALIMTALLRAKSGIQNSDKLVNRIIRQVRKTSRSIWVRNYRLLSRLTAEAQLIPSLVTIALLIIRFVCPSGSTIILAGVGAPKLWIVTCMIVINQRARLSAAVESERQRRQNNIATITTDIEKGVDSNGVLLDSSRSPPLIGDQHKQDMTPVRSSSLPQLDCAIVDSPPAGTFAEELSSDREGSSMSMSFLEMIRGRGSIAQ